MSRTMIDKYQVESNAKNSAVKRKGGKVKFASKDPAEMNKKTDALILKLLSTKELLTDWEKRFLINCYCLSRKLSPKENNCLRRIRKRIS